MVIALPSDRVTVATVALLKSTSPTGVTSSAVKPLNAVDEGESCTESAAFRPGGMPSSTNSSSLLGAAAVPELVEPVAPEAPVPDPAEPAVLEAAAPAVPEPTGPEALEPAVPAAAVPPAADPAAARCTV